MTVAGSAKRSVRHGFATLGQGSRFVQENQSYSKKAGTLRGMHFQVPPAPQAKLITVLRGRILDVAIDIRRNSPTYGKFVSKELSANSGLQMYVPVGFAHGFLTLEDDVTVQYKVSDYYAPKSEIGIRWNDPDVACRGQWLTLTSSCRTRTGSIRF